MVRLNLDNSTVSKTLVICCNPVVNTRARKTVPERRSEERGVRVGPAIGCGGDPPLEQDPEGVSRIGMRPRTHSHAVCASVRHEVGRTNRVWPQRQEGRGFPRKILKVLRFTF